MLEIVLVDDHRGQVLGLYSLWRVGILSCCSGIGLFLVKLALLLAQQRFDLFEPHRQITELDAYDHLCRVIRMCVTHFVRHVRPFKGKEVEAVYRAMLSLASSDPLADFEGQVALIKRDGSKEAKGALVYCMTHANYLPKFGVTRLACREGDLETLRLARNLSAALVHPRHNLEVGAF